jgi:hypothetical protein
MKRVLVSIFASVVFLLGFVISNPAQAQTLAAIPFLSGTKTTQLTPEQKAMFKELEEEILPKFDIILTPEQRETFTTAIASGKSLRKAFKSILLSPDQKSQLAGFLKEITNEEMFAALTPEQKKTFFMKKKEVFMPTPEEISEKIADKMKMAKDKGATIPTPEEIGEKISAGMKAKGVTPEEISEKIADKMKMAKDKGATIPTPEEIGEKISAKMKMVKSKIEDVVEEAVSE